jgi:hypothetical protein
VANALEVPLKYVPRALALLQQYGLVTRGEILRLNRDAVARSKNPSGLVRRGISAALRARVFVADGYVCAYCGKRKKPVNSTVDHIIPLSLGGADEPGNWVTACKADNRRTWHLFSADKIRYYRGHKVQGHIGVRSRGEQLWPHINGSLRTERRNTWS